jgi:hypothetical protein
MRRLQRDGALGNNASNPSTADVTFGRATATRARSPVGAMRWYGALLALRSSRIPFRAKLRVADVLKGVKSPM